MRFRTSHLPGLLLAFVLLLPARGLALEPRQIALVVNRNVPESVELAKFYTRARLIPEGRIIQLDLPFAEQMPFEDYHVRVVEPIRAFLRQNNLEEQVQCLVTFYGVPLRIAARAVTPAEQIELAVFRGELLRVQTRLSQSVQELERLARRVEPAFAPEAPPGPAGLARRADLATRAVTDAASRMTDPVRRQKLIDELNEVSRPLLAPAGDPPTTQPARTALPATQPFDPAAIAPLLTRQHDPAAREQLRALVRRSTSPFAYERILQEQMALLNPEHTDSAVDNELALLWADGYTRAGWLPNPLAYPHLGTPGLPRTIMVARLDAPQPQQVERIVLESLRAERDGLRGRVVIDSRGIAPRKPDGSPDAFGLFDQRLRELVAFVKSRVDMELVHDDAPEVLPAGSVEGVALYCGWYSVGQYVPSVTLVPGSVGFHVASYELTSLRDESNTGWVRGLINDGIAATLGPVSEPLLHAFPMPDDFFPLLLSGQLTLAEVYWRTTPLVSWKMTLIGDPLYTPYKTDPAISVDQLPQRLRGIFSDAPATQPAG